MPGALRAACDGPKAGGDMRRQRILPAGVGAET